MPTADPRRGPDGPGARSSSATCRCSSRAWPSRGTARTRPRPGRRWRRLPAHARPRGVRREARGRHVAGRRAGEVPLPGDPQRDRRRQGPSGRRRRGQGRRCRDPGHRQPAAGRVDDVDAAPVLLDLAKSAADEKYKIRALRGYIRLVRQFAMPDAERGRDVPRRHADRPADAEKKLVLEVHRTLSRASTCCRWPSKRPRSRAEERRRGGGDDHRREDRRPVGRAPEDARPRWATAR